MSTTTVIRFSAPSSTTLGDVGLERRVAALVLGDLRVADPDDAPGAWRRRSAGRSARRPSAPGTRTVRLVPDVADVVADARVGEDVVVARRARASRGRPAAGRFHQRSARPTPPGSSAKRHRPSSDLRSRVAVSRGLSMRASAALRAGPALARRARSARRARRRRARPCRG